MLNDAIAILRDQVGIETTEVDWGFESVTAERDELDPEIIKVAGTGLPALVMTCMYIFVDQKTGNDYVVYFITDITSSHEYTRGILVEGKLLWSKWLP